jgi:hypothetical protein
LFISAHFPPILPHLPHLPQNFASIRVYSRFKKIAHSRNHAILIASLLAAQPRPSLNNSSTWGQKRSWHSHPILPE